MGSIPASAGEPSSVPDARKIHGVYPRECGGTPPVSIIRQPGKGLSPRVRGNLPQLSPLSLAPRSIPASAGEPNRRESVRHSQSVYPRECGGTPS